MFAEPGKDEEGQAAISRELLRYIWIKSRNDWGVEDIMEDEAQEQKQIEKHCEVHRKIKIAIIRPRHQSRQFRPDEASSNERRHDQRKEGGQKESMTTKAGLVPRGEKRLDMFWNEIDESARRHPNKMRKYKAKFEQDMKIL